MIQIGMYPSAYIEEQFNSGREAETWALLLVSASVCAFIGPKVHSSSVLMSVIPAAKSDPTAAFYWGMRVCDITAIAFATYAAGWVAKKVIDIRKSWFEGSLAKEQLRQLAAEHTRRSTRAGSAVKRKSNHRETRTHLTRHSLTNASAAPNSFVWRSRIENGNFYPTTGAKVSAKRRRRANHGRKPKRRTRAERWVALASLLASLCTIAKSVPSLFKLLHELLKMLR